MQFGSHIRELRLAKFEADPRFSVRKLAKAVGIEPCYLSRIEREDLPPPSSAIIERLALELGQNPDVLLAMAGKVSDRLLRAILKAPREFAALIESLDDHPERLSGVVTRVRDGEW